MARGHSSLPRAWNLRLSDPPNGTRSLDPTGPVHGVLRGPLGTVLELPVPELLRELVATGLGALELPFE
eukprot:14674979-Alexandrium_andersonii.AAC.1